MVGNTVTIFRDSVTSFAGRTDRRTLRSFEFTVWACSKGKVVKFPQKSCTVGVVAGFFPIGNPGLELFDQNIIM